MGTEKVSRKPRAAVVAAGTEAETEGKAEAEGKVITSRSRAGGRTARLAGAEWINSGGWARID